MTDDRDITERLEDKSIDGAIFLRINAAMEIRRLREYSSKQALDIVTLGQEVGRLREVLEDLTRECKEHCLDECQSDCKRMSRCRFFKARAALAEKEEK